jgi:HK97 family phage prohead protease
MENSMLMRSTPACASGAATIQAPFRAAAQQHMTQPPTTRGMRASEAVPASYNADSHTVELVLSSGSRVKRWGYFEELLIDAAAIDLSRVASGAVKVLNSHNAYDVGAILGTLLSARIEGGQLVGTMKFADTAAALDAERMVAKGDLTSVSIGYEVKLWRASEVITDPNTESDVTVWRGEEWTLLEASFVSVPADPSAGVRSAVPASGNSQSAVSGGATKEDDMLTRANPGAPPPAVSPGTAATRFNGEEAIDFVEQARAFGVEVRARELVVLNNRGEIGVQECRNSILATAAERQRSTTSVAPAGAAAHITSDPVDVTRAGMQDALVSRMSGRDPTSDMGRNFRSMSMIEMSRYAMRQRGEQRVDFMSTTEIAKRMMTTSDFPMLLQNSGNRVLMDAFGAAPNPLKTLARKTTVDDFRAKYSVKVGAKADFQEVLEDGLYTYGGVLESYENYKIGKWGKIFSFSFESVVNDDLGAFANFTKTMGDLSAETEARLLVELLTANDGAGPKMTDGKYLFSSDHGNVADQGSVISIETLSSARLAMRTQKHLNGTTLAPTVPNTLLVGAEKETEADTILAALTAAKTNDVNPFSGKLTSAVEPRITGNQWYVFADPALAPVLEYAYLTGFEGPQFETREGFERDGIQMKVRLMFGCGAVDHRGVYRNGGNDDI